MSREVNVMEVIDSPEWGTNRVEAPASLLIFALIRAARPQVIVDCGTHRGCSSTILALASPGAQVHTFDPVDHGAREHWERWGVDDQITFHQRRSDSPPEDLKDVHFIFFDAAHELVDGRPAGVHTGQYALEEWTAWRDRLLPGALVGWHDSVPRSSLYAALEQIQQTNDLDLVKFLPTPSGLALGIWKPRAWHARRVLAELDQLENGGPPTGFYLWDDPRDVTSLAGPNNILVGI
ncbi:MAG: hypothetical protein CL878_11390 [Dehalococcoidia bacterium]|nr:hypothetical protein [Dehalococcoidia bacterium]